MRVVLDGGARMPKRAHDTDAGFDLCSTEDKIVPAHGSAVFSTGVHVELPKHTAGVLVSKSGLNVKRDITSTGLIDEGYTGSICVKLYNNGDNPYRVYAGDKISQLVIVPVLWPEMEEAESLSSSERGGAGFGSTGR